MNNQIIASSSCQKDLGIIISENGLPGDQCRAAAKKANQVLEQINRSFTCYNKEVMLPIYKVFIRPHLEYGIAAWCPWLKKDIETLEKIQRRATRRMSDIRGSYPERLQQLDLTTLEERRSRGDAIETFKCLKGFLDVETEPLFTIDKNN